MKKIIFIIVILSIGIAVAAVLRFPGKAAAKLNSRVCDAELWSHVYEKDRLHVIEDCVAVEGRVLSIHYNSDGDVHIGLEPQDKSVLNLINVIHAHRELIVEVICDHPPTKESAKQACKNFRSKVTIPKIGERIRVSGSYVTDRELGWREIHPVTKIEVLQTRSSAD